MIIKNPDKHLTRQGTKNNMTQVVRLKVSTTKKTVAASLRIFLPIQAISC